MIVSTESFLHVYSKLKVVDNVNTVNYKFAYVPFFFSHSHFHWV